MVLVMTIFRFKEAVMKSQVGYSIGEVTEIGYDIDADKCADCGMSADHKDFNWHHPEALSDEQMNQG